jgi:SAM-dependent methyltransferase
MATSSRQVADRVGRALRFRLHRLRDVALDAAERWRGSPELIPPRRLLGGDYSEFERIGEEFKRYFVELGGLEHHHAVLDVGCGPGRMAVPLMNYLTADGRYEGFDVVPREIRWCQDHITPRQPNFRFQLADVRNRHYNPDGDVPAAEFRFPYDDSSFDLVVLVSVFTHMLEPEVARYLGEVGRVLRPGGRCVVTYFLLNDDSRRRIAAGESYFSFPAGDGAARFEDPDDPEAVVAYEESFVRGRHIASGLPIKSVHGGYWCGRSDYLTWQDVVVASRATSSSGPEDLAAS